MAGLTSLEAVKRKIKMLQEQADGAEVKVEKLQKDLAGERKAREAVSGRGGRGWIMMGYSHSCSCGMSGHEYSVTGAAEGFEEARLRHM